MDAVHQTGPESQSFRPFLMPLSPPPPQARRRSLAGRANFSAAANKGRKTSRSFRGRMSTGSGQERSGEQSRLILRPSLCGAETYPAPPRRARRRRRTSATRAAKKTTGLQAATPGRGQKGRQNAPAQDIFAGAQRRPTATGTRTARHLSANPQAGSLFRSRQPCPTGKQQRFSFSAWMHE